MFLSPLGVALEFAWPIQEERGMSWRSSHAAQMDDLTEASGPAHSARPYWLCFPEEPAKDP